jgi:hypothetical protein
MDRTTISKDGRNVKNHIPSGTIRIGTKVAPKDKAAIASQVAAGAAVREVAANLGLSERHTLNHSALNAVPQIGRSVPKTLRSSAIRGLSQQRVAQTRGGGSMIDLRCAPHF